MSEALSEEELEMIRSVYESSSEKPKDMMCFMLNDHVGTLLSEIDRLRAENKELREEDLSGTKAKVKAIEQITYYRSEVNRLNNVIADRDTRIDMLREIVVDARPLVMLAANPQGGLPYAIKLLARMDKALEEK